MKRLVAVSALLLPLLTAQAAVANVVLVDFSVLGIDSVDITTTANPAGLTLDGLTFTYDAFGMQGDDDYGNPVAAFADAGGLFGNTYGSLVLDLATPATDLSLDFSLLGTTECESTSSAMFVILRKSSDDVTDSEASAVFIPYDAGHPDDGGDAVGSFAYSGPAFDHAEIYFTEDAPYFSVTSVAYAPAPEPATLALLAASLLTGRMRRTHACNRMQANPAPRFIFRLHSPEQRSQAET